MVAKILSELDQDDYGLMAMKGTLKDFEACCDGAGLEWKRDDEPDDYEEALTAGGSGAGTESIVACECDEAVLIWTGCGDFGMMPDVAVSLSKHASTPVVSGGGSDPSSTAAFAIADSGEPVRVYWTQDAEVYLDIGNPLAWESEHRLGDGLFAAIPAMKELGFDFDLARDADRFVVYIIQSASLKNQGPLFDKINDAMGGPF